MGCRVRDWRSMVGFAGRARYTGVGGGATFELFNAEAQRRGGAERTGKECESWMAWVAGSGIGGAWLDSRGGLGTRALAAGRRLNFLTQRHRGAEAQRGKGRNLKAVWHGLQGQGLAEHGWIRGEGAVHGR